MLPRRENQSLLYGPFPPRGRLRPRTAGTLPSSFKRLRNGPMIFLEEPQKFPLLLPLAMPVPFGIQHHPPPLPDIHTQGQAKPQPTAGAGGRQDATCCVFPIGLVPGQCYPVNSSDEASRSAAGSLWASGRC